VKSLRLEPQDKLRRNNKIPVQENEEPGKIEKQTYKFLHIPQYEKTKGYFFKPRRYG